MSIPFVRPTNAELENFYRLAAASHEERTVAAKALFIVLMADNLGVMYTHAIREKLPTTLFFGAMHGVHKAVLEEIKQSINEEFATLELVYERAWAVFTHHAEAAFAELAATTADLHRVREELTQCRSVLSALETRFLSGGGAAAGQSD